MVILSHINSLRWRRHLLRFVSAMLSATTIANTAGVRRAPAADTELADAAIAVDRVLVPEALLKVCEAREFTFQQNREASHVYYYRLFKPVPNPTIKRYPLIVWVHGHGEYELKVRNSGHLSHVHQAILRDLDHLESYPLYLLAVQCPQDEVWISGKPYQQKVIDPAEISIMILRKLLNEFPIDRDRIYLVGISSGGTASWEMAKRHPDLFAAVAPLASTGCSTKGLDQLSKTPIWAFHSTRDLGTSVTHVRSTVQALRKIGGNCVLTETNGPTHDCWTAAFNEYPLSEWLLSQSRGSANSPLPGAVGYWTRIQLAARSLLQSSQDVGWGGVGAIVVVVTIVLAMRRHLRQFAPKR